MSGAPEPVPPHATEREADKRQPTGADWIIPAIGLAFATYYLLSIRNLVWEAKIAAVFVAVVLYALIGVYVLVTVVGLKRGSLRIDFSPLWGNLALFRIRALLFGLAALSVLALPWAGFTLGTFGFLLVSFLWLEKMPWKLAVITSGALAIAGYVLFIVALRTAFPPGPFELAMRALTGI